MIRQILKEISTGVVSGLAALGAVYKRARSGEDSLLEELRATRQRVQQLEQELGALCSASAGVGEHVVTLEQQVLRITSCAPAVTAPTARQISWCTMVRILKNWWVPAV